MKNYNKLTNAEKLACLSLYPEEAKKDSDGYTSEFALYLPRHTLNN